jgi:peptidoglycan/xylan/chitin deacetylase (PgdA/CDA1 family)
MYHAVSDEWEDPLSVRPRDFERQLRSLVSRGFRGASVADLLARPDDRRLLHVTFDDAYRSVANALPVLRELRVPCSIYVCTDYATGGRSLEIPSLAARGSRDDLATMDWATLRELSHDGLVEIGSHGLGHADLTTLGDDELQRELVESRAALERELDRPCTSVAYPFGRQDARVRAATGAAGYEAAFGVPGLSSSFDALRIARTGIWRDEAPARQRLRTNGVVRRVLERRDPANRSG